MNLNCSNKVIKYLMFTFNLVFVITGIIMIAVGVSVKTYYYKYNTFLDDQYFSLPNLLIATGSLIFFISFLGCYGAMKENWVMLLAFSVLLGMIFIFEFSAGIAGYVLRDKTSSYLEQKLMENMKYYNTSPPVSEMWDLIQEEFECCGVKNYTDWQSSFQFLLPTSCCPRQSGTIGVLYCNSFQHTTLVTPTVTPNTTASTAVSEGESTIVKAVTTDSVTTNATTTVESTTVAVTTTTENSNATNEYPVSTSNPYTSGCEAAFGTFVKKHAVDIGAVGMVLAVIQLFGIIFSCHLARQVKNGYYST